MQDPTIVVNPPEKFTMRVLATESRRTMGDHVGAGSADSGRPSDEAAASSESIQQTGRDAHCSHLPEAHTTFTQDGLLGLALHPDFLQGLVGNDFVYVAFTYDDAPGPALARRLGIRRYQYEANRQTLSKPMDI